MNSNPKVIKSFTSQSSAMREAKGHAFFSQYYDKIPALLAQNLSGNRFEIEYQNVISPDTTLVTDVLNTNAPVSLTKLFKRMAMIVNSYGEDRKTQGGTQLFFLQRLPRLRSLQMQKSYSQWVQLQDKNHVNGSGVMIYPKLINDLASAVEKFTHGFCAPSQGDLHERNFFTDGTIIDFEGAGWNLVATDLATFIWHTLFAGPYFSERYAKWATPDTKRLSYQQNTSIAYAAGDVTVRIPYNRQLLLRDYLLSFVQMIDDNKRDTCLDGVSQAISFRLLTTFPLFSMSKQDQTISFVLANFFYDDRLSFQEKMDVFLTD